MVPKAKRLDSLCGEKTLAFFIMLPLFGKAMATTIEFDGKLRFDAEKIEEVNPARIFTTEFEFIEAPVAQETPEPLRGVRGFFAESAGEVSSGCYSGTPGHPSP
jgi:hypothetical protein